MTQHDAIVLDGLDLCGRDVDHHVAVAEEAGHRAQPDQIGLELAEPDLRGDVHRGIAVLAHDAVGRQAVARLEALDRGVDIGVEGWRDAGARRQVARNHQPLAQRLDVRIDRRRA